MNGIAKVSSENNEKGFVFNIQKFSTHDGPGIRTTVFMKGCPLKCNWCANPESKLLPPQLMVRDINCKACGRCVDACPQHAIYLTEEPRRRIDWSLCNQCLQCTEVCIYESLGVVGRYMSVDEIVEEVEKDRIFYKNSGGGVTLSGGEPLFQWRFVRNLLKVFKERDLHTALDTCGCAPEEAFEEIIPYVDLVLFDIKHLDAEKHLGSTGVDNRLILRNAATVAKKVRTWFRVPLIPGFNESPEHIRRVGELAKELGVEKVSLLPYHEGGKLKSSQIGETYQNSMANVPDEDLIQRVKHVLGETGVTVSVGS